MNQKHEINLGESEYRFACIIWEHEPIASGDLVKKAATLLDWKKSTTYTVLKNLISKGILQNENSIVTSLIKKTEVQQHESEAFINRTFDGSLPQFVAAFLGNKKISAEELAEIQQLIENHKGGASS